MFSLRYRVYSADQVEIRRTIEVDGEEMIAAAPGLSVQLTPEFAGSQGTITLNLTTKQAEGLSIDVGDIIEVSFKSLGPIEEASE